MSHCVTFSIFHSNATYAARTDEVVYRIYRIFGQVKKRREEKEKAIKILIPLSVFTFPFVSNSLFRKFQLAKASFELVQPQWHISTEISHQI